MSVPALTKTWVFAANNRIVFVSLNDTMARFLFGIKNFLITNLGYTVKYTCNGTTGPSSSSDHTDRWSSSSNVTTRGANTTSANSFVVLTDGNGADVCFSYVGGSDDIARISFSPSGVYTPAGTATNTPTATDEQVVTSGNSLIGATASIDRVWHCMASSDNKLFRVLICRDGAFVGLPWGVELVTSLVTVTFSPAIWGFAFLTSNWTNFIGSSTSGGVARANSTNITTINGIIEGANTFNNNGGIWQNTKTEAQAGTGYPIRPITIGSNTSGATGPIGDLIDWWTGKNSATDGDLYGDHRYITTSLGMMWPWNGVDPFIMA